MDDFPHRLPTEERTRAVIALLMREAVDPRLSDRTRAFARKLLAGHQRYLAEFIAEREAAQA